MPLPSTRHILESIVETYDLALDYAEHEVGVNDFRNNWPIIRAKADAEQKIAAWLKAIGAEADPKEICRTLDELAANATEWLTPYTGRFNCPDKDLHDLL